jgi:polyhydroxybutyrate depolymerase
MRPPRLMGWARVMAVAVAFCAPHVVFADTIVVDGLDRTYRLDLAGDGAAPVLFVLHGGEGNARRMQRYVGIDAATSGVHVVYPEAFDRWGDGRRLADGSLLESTDDVAFLDALIDQLVQQGLAAPDQIAIAGISNGGMMAIRMACDSRHDLAGIAVVAASWPEGLRCAPLRPVKFLHFSGTDDPILPFTGGAISGLGERGRVMSADATLTRFLTTSGCDGVEDTLLADAAEDGTRVTLRMGSECLGGPAPQQYIISGGGHSWPGARAVLGRLVGVTSADISASSIMISAFFGR